MTPPTERVKKKKKCRQFRLIKKIRPIITVTIRMISLEPSTDANFMIDVITEAVCWSAQYATVSSTKNPGVPDVSNVMIKNKNKNTATIINNDLLLDCIFPTTLSPMNIHFSSLFYRIPSRYTIFHILLKKTNK